MKKIQGVFNPQAFKKSELGKLVLTKYVPKKDLNRKAAKFIEPFLSKTGQERFASCGDYIAHLTNEEMSVKRVHKSNSCGNRFCPICTWSKAKKDAVMISILLEAIRGEENQEFIMLTLTSPNVSTEILTQEIDKFNLAFKNLMKRQAVKKVVKGYIRKLEITSDQERFITSDLYKRKQAYFEKRDLKEGDNNPQYNTYNPHFHVLLSVNKSYFTDTKSYLSRDEWLGMWKECMGDESITQLDIRKVRATANGDMGAVLEVAKYSAKGNEIYHSQEVFTVFYKVLKGRQLITFNGLFKDYVKKFKSGELDKYKKTDENHYTHLLESFWKKAKYDNVLRVLSPEEIEEFNQQAEHIEENDEID